MNSSSSFNPSRRQLLQSSACGFGYLALRGLLGNAQALDNPLLSKASHFPARAKRMIFLFMRGGPSQVDSFDYKPDLSKRHNEDLGGGRKYFQSPWKFSQHGQCGLPVSELFPHIARHADDLCVVNSMYTDIGNHPQATLQMNTGSFQFIRPSVGAWINYGLGTENQNLPGFITITPDFSSGGSRNYGSAFLPAACAGTRIGEGSVGNGEGFPPLKGVKIPYTKNAQFSASEQRRQLDLLQALNRERLAADAGSNPPLEGIIQSYETAFRMQSEMPELMAVDKEPQHVLDRYGIGDGKVSDNYGRACLMARRFCEAGVRFIQLNHSFWDHHKDLVGGMEKHASQTDQPVGALLTDLKERGLLEDTIVLWGGEFGRPPILNKNKGRDHNPDGFTMWMAGGGAKGGIRYGLTDELGYKSVEDKVHLYDLQATFLHLLGLDHEKLTYRYNGRDFRLTDVHGRVVPGLVA